jgi:hypothetical protein
MPKHYTITLPKGYQLTLVADEFTSGSYVHINGSDSIGYVAASKTFLIGPFNESRHYDIVSDTGTISHSQTCSGVYTKNDETNVSDYLTRVDALDDLPVAVGGVITLDSNKAYHFTKDIDLLGDRLLGGDNTAILGTSSETSSITSTGLGVGVALFTTAGTTPIQNISFKDVDTALDIDGTGVEAFDWFAFNIVNVPNIGIIKDVNNWVYSNSAILNSNGLILNGTSGTLGINNCLFTSDGTAESIITIPATSVVSRRVRFIYSSFVVSGSSVGIDINASATIPTESYILDTLNFSGAGTYLAGLDDTSNNSLFVNCVGIVNTSVNGQAYMQDNSTVTTVSATDTWYKAAGTTIASTDNSKYTHTNNRLTNAATIERKYLVQATISFEAGSNNICKFGFYDSKAVAVRTPSQIKATANSGGRDENVTLTDVVAHSEDDYIEVHIQNTSSTANITVTDLNIVITEII